MSGIKTIFKAIRLFLFSNMNKQFLVFTFFLFLSGIFWLITTMNDTYEKEIKIPIQVSNVPKNVVLTSTAIDTLRVTVRDKGWVILSYLYGDRLKMLSLKYSIDLILVNAYTLTFPFAFTIPLTLCADVIAEHGTEDKVLFWRKLVQGTGDDKAYCLQTLTPSEIDIQVLLTGRL